MPLSVATWNINSVRLRMPIVERLLLENAPDILCLQETKCPDEQFPSAAFRKLGYHHIAFSGQKGYHGVAIVARRPIELVEKRRFCDIEDCRHISVRFSAGGKLLTLHNFYVPAGGDEPDPAVNWKFKHKLDFVAEMNAIRADRDEDSGSILVGDLNIAPLEHDVWSHKQLLNVVSHTPVETESFEAMRKAGKWVDLMRHNVPASRSSTLGGATARRTGGRRIAGGGSTMSGRRRIWCRSSPDTTSCATRAAGTGRPTTCR
jgi:exodeoxyribonuclease III